MKTYFEYKGFKVVDYEDQEFAKYTIIGTNRCFDDLAQAIIYCIGSGEGHHNNSKLDAYVDTFLTMVRK